jgi:hypothetical protein
LVLGETLGSAIRFERDGSRIEIRFRIDDWAFLRATGTSATEKQSNGAISIRGINVLVFECTVSALEGGLSESAEDEADEELSNFLRRTYQTAEGVAADFVECARLRGQPWLGVHGQRPELVGDPRVSDGHADHWLDVDGVPYRNPEPQQCPVEAAISPDVVSSLAGLLGDERPELPIAETLLADALHFAWLNPPDLQRAVLMAAIGCEVKVKARLREKVSAEGLPLIDLLLGNPRDWSVAAIALFDKGMFAALHRSLKSENRELYKRVSQMFELRNRIAHLGERPNELAAKDAIAAVREVFRWLDEL